MDQMAATMKSYALLVYSLHEKLLKFEFVANSQRTDVISSHAFGAR